ncbi:MAG: L-threonylcarbamoyladenylate synthase, partial [Longimicrobiales bacterium]|nr:L-threonylcarbamoyladenylate synthase [Longimicrobiales bacterium]
MTRLLPYRSADERRAAHGELARHLAAGGIIAYPTETVYGLGCRLDDVALTRLAAFKGDRPFLLLIRGRGDALGLHWTEDADRLAAAFWPGPLTLALAAEPEAYPPQVVGTGGTVAVRVSPHPAIPDLLEAAGGPVTSTSANAPGEPPARDATAAAHVAAAVAALAAERRGAEAGGGGDEEDRTVLVLDGGRLPQARPSTIVGCGERTRVLREGALPV